MNDNRNGKKTFKNSKLFPGSIIYLGKVAGSIFCGFASECFGRRNAMIFINVTHFITFYLFYYSDSVTKVFIANVLLGFGAGFMKAPWVNPCNEKKTRRRLQYCLLVIVGVPLMLRKLAKYRFVVC